MSLVVSRLSVWPDEAVVVDGYKETAFYFVHKTSMEETFVESST